MSKEKILDRIRKLLSKTTDRGASVNEAEIALSMATKLMRQHQIEQSEVELSPTDFGQTDILAFRRRYENSKWEWQMLQVIADANLCQVVGTKLGGPKAPQGIRLTIIGTEENRAVVEHLFLQTRDFLRSLYPQAHKAWKEKTIEVLCRKLTEDFVRDHWNAFERDNVVTKRSQWIASYLLGAVQGVYNRLKKDDLENFKEAEAYGLIKVKHDDLINQYMNEIMPHVKESKSRRTKIDGEAYAKGKKDGSIDPSRKMLN